MKELLHTMVRALVHHPDEVRITEFDGARTWLFEVRCHAEDRGRVTGKGGRTIGAIRTLASAVGQRDGRQVIVEVVA